MGVYGLYAATFGRQHKERHAGVMRAVRISRVSPIIHVVRPTIPRDCRRLGGTGTTRCRVRASKTLSYPRHDHTTRPSDPEQVQVSIRRIQYEKAWAKVEEMQSEDVVFEGPIIAVNRGGAIVLVEVRKGS